MEMEYTSIVKKKCVFLKNKPFNNIIYMSDLIYRYIYIF